MTQKFKNSKLKLNAFSMIELSIVILIIGILISGILASNAIIKKFRIQTAQTLTISSPVQGIPDSVLWLESSLDKSFKDSESSDTTSLSTWYDVRESVNKNNATQSNSANYPTYSNSINSIHAVKFDGTNGYFSVDGSVLNDTNYTIFVLEQRESSKSGNYFIGDSSSSNESTTNKNLVLGYSADGTIKHSQSSDNSYTSSISSYSSSNGKPRVFTFVHDKSVGKKTYINGLLAATSTDTNSLSGMTTLTIGKSYQGQLGEIVIFARALTTEERQSVEDYLGKKWNSKILRSVGSSASSGGIGGSCVGGTVGDSGCLTACTVTAANGITDTTVGGGSGSLICNTSAHFSGSLPYTCLNGVFQYTGTTSCSCASGYNLVSGVCTPINPSCSGGNTVDTTSMSGYKIHVFTSSGTLTCTAGGTIQYLIVAAGGGGGWGGGAGGAGGLIYNSAATISATSYSITVGAGSGGKGGNSVFNNITAIGGGNQCGTGGSGGGGGYGSGCSGAGTSGQGNAGGSCNVTNSCGQGGGGGGGAGSAGSNPAGTWSGGNGGTGLYYGNVFSNNYGDNGWFASGGGGSGTPSNGGTIGTASSGGGGAGSNYSGGTRYSGTANTGGGGGGGNGAGTNGGSGIVIIRYAQ